MTGHCERTHGLRYDAYLIYGIRFLFEKREPTSQRHLLDHRPAGNYSPDQDIIYLIPLCQQKVTCGDGTRTVSWRSD